MIVPLDDVRPDTSGALFVAWNAHICGDVRLGANTSVWYGTTMRGDIAPIIIGDCTNIQDNSVCHVSRDVPLIIGNNITVGHGVILHSCKIADNCIIGMGATILDGAEIGEFSMVGAGTLIPPGKKFPPRSVIIGNPGRVLRDITPADEERIRNNVESYIANAKRFALSDAVNIKTALNG